jgi:hypothetical protein
VKNVAKVRVKFIEGKGKTLQEKALGSCQMAQKPLISLLKGIYKLKGQTAGKF